MGCEKGAGKGRRRKREGKGVEKRWKKEEKGGKEMVKREKRVRKGGRQRERRQGERDKWRETRGDTREGEQGRETRCIVCNTVYNSGAASSATISSSAQRHFDITITSVLSDNSSVAPMCCELLPEGKKRVRRENALMMDEDL